MKQQAWDVYQNGKLVDTVFFNTHADGGAPIMVTDVYMSLVEHDGYSHTIVVKKPRGR